MMKKYISPIATVYQVEYEGVMAASLTQTESMHMGGNKETISSSLSNKKEDNPIWGSME